MMAFLQGLLLCAVALVPRAHAAAVDDFRAQLLALVPEDHPLRNYSSAYVEFMDAFGKLQANYTDGALNASFYNWVARERSLAPLNEQHQYNVSLFAEDPTTGNYTVPNGTLLVDQIYGHTFFSDLSDDDYLRFLMNETYDEPATSASARAGVKCRGLYKDALDFEYGFGVMNAAVCGSVQDQGPYGTCWAFAAVKQYQCEDNAHSAGSFDNFDVPVCDTIRNANAGGINGGWPYLAMAYYVEDGACKSGSGLYPSCATAPFTCTERFAPKPAACVRVDFPKWLTGEWLGVSRLLSRDSPDLQQPRVYGVVLSVYVGKHFQELVASGARKPITAKTLCASKLGGHAMVAIGTSVRWDTQSSSLYVMNSWGTKWGDNGGFWMSLGAYLACRVGPPSFVTFNSLLANGEKAAADSASAGALGRVAAVAAAALGALAL